MGPQTLEGDVYHSSYLVNDLAKRAKEERKERVKLQSQILDFKNFISSIVSPFCLLRLLVPKKELLMSLRCS